MTKRKKAPEARLVLVRFVDHAMSFHPHWHDGDAPEPPAKRGGDCLTSGWLSHVSDEWIQVVHVVTRGQHGHYSDIHRGSVKSVRDLITGDEVEL